MTTLNLAIGPELQVRRVRRRLTQRELARLAKISQTTICRVEAGLQVPTLRVISALERHVGRLDEPDPAARPAVGAQATAP